MPDYQKGKIYRIISPSKNLVYYGSTTQSLAQRLAGHKSDYKKYNENNNRRKCSSFLILECEDYKIELIEQYPCNNQQQLFRKEGDYIRDNECVNICIAGRTEQEYHLDNINKKKEYDKQYHIDNMEKKREITKQYHINNPNRLKEWRFANDDRIKEYQKQYRLKKKLEQVEIE